MSNPQKEWSWLGAGGSELRVMQLPDRKALYLVLNNDDGMHCVARTTGDREAAVLAAWLDEQLRGGPGDT